MKKRTLSTLLLAGVMAATMVPTAVFAAASTTKTDTTTVGYTAGGVVSPDGTVMISVPKAVDFNANAEVSGFDVVSHVWAADQGKWVEAGSENTAEGGNYQLGTGVEITVKVQSATGYNLRRNPSEERGQGEYQYTVDGLQYTDGTDGVQQGGILNTKTATKQVTLGTLKDGVDDAKYSFTGKVKMTKTPTAGQTEPATRFSDTLTYTFENLPEIKA